MTATGTFGIVQTGRDHIDREEQVEHINQDVALTFFHTFVSVKTADPGGFLDDLDADPASMIAALGCAFLPTRSRSAPTPGSEQSKPGAFEAQAANVIEDRLPGWKITR